MDGYCKFPVLRKKSIVKDTDTVCMHCMLNFQLYLNLYISFVHNMYNIYSQVEKSLIFQCTEGHKIIVVVTSCAWVSQFHYDRMTAPSSVSEYIK